MLQRRWPRRFAAGAGAGLLAASFAVTLGLGGASAATMAETQKFTANAPFVSNNIDVKRTVSHSELYAGDEFTVTYELQNTGKNGGFATGGTDWFQHYFEDTPPAAVQFLGMDVASTKVYRGGGNLNAPTAWDGAPANPNSDSGSVLIDWRHKDGGLSGGNCTAVGPACSLAKLSDNGSTPTTLTLRYQVKADAPLGQLSGWTSKSQIEVEGANTLTWSAMSLPTVIGAAATTTGNVAATPNPVVVGAATRLSAQVTGIPEGSAIDFVTTGSPSSVLCTGEVAGGNAGCDWTPAAVADVDVIAKYAGAKESAPSSSPAATTVKVGKGAVTVGQVTVNPNPATVGKPVTLGVDVSGGQQGVEVQFRSGDAVLCAADTDANGHAQCDGWTPQAAGDAQVIAHYTGGNATEVAASAPVTVAVQSAVVAVADVTATPNPATVGKPVTVATNAVGGEQGAAVQFRDGDTVLCEGVLDAAGRAQCEWTPEATGPAHVIAHYAGGATTEPSASRHAVTVQVEAVPAAASSTSPVSISGVPEVGSTLTLAAAVADGAAGVDVQFRSGQGVVLCTAQTDADGSASCDWRLTAAGVTAVTAHYAGDAATAPSQSPTATTVSVSTPPTFGAPTIAISPINPLAGDTVRVTVRVPGAAEGSAAAMTADGVSVCADLTLRADGTAECAWTPSSSGSHVLKFTVAGANGPVTVEKTVLVGLKDIPVEPGGDAGAGGLGSLGSLMGLFG